MLFVVLCPETPEGSTGSGSCFKASQKTGQWLKVSSDRLVEAGNRTCDPWFTRHRFIPYTTAASQKYRFQLYIDTTANVCIRCMNRDMMVCATSKGSEQPAHTRSLIRAFASRLNIL